MSLGWMRLIFQETEGVSGMDEANIPGEKEKGYLGRPLDESEGKCVSLSHKLF